MTTLKELAKLVNVSVSTVSKALSDSPEIGEDTKKRIREVAELYNYKPNKMAFALKKNQTKTIGVIVPDILNHFFATVLYGIEKAATEKGYDTLVNVSNESHLQEEKGIEVLTNGRVDGFIMSLSIETLEGKPEERLKTLQSVTQPVVLFDRVTDQISCDKVVIDGMQAVDDATLTLIRQGRKKIAFVSSISDLRIGQLREEGYVNALKRNQLPVEDTKIINLKERRFAHQQLKTFLLREQVDAVISADNTSGIMVISIARELGLKVPEDIAVIGFGDEQTSYLSYPQLSYIDQNAEDIGIRATELLIERLERQAQGNPQKSFYTYNIPTKLRIKNSSKKA